MFSRWGSGLGMSPRYACVFTHAWARVQLGATVPVPEQAYDSVS